MQEIDALIASLGGSAEAGILQIFERVLRADIEQGHSLTESLNVIAGTRGGFGGLGVLANKALNILTPPKPAPEPRAPKPAASRRKRRYTAPRLDLTIEDKKHAFLIAFAVLRTVDAAANAIGISKATHNQWIGKDPAYKERYEGVRRSFDAPESLVEALERRINALEATVRRLERWEKRMTTASPQPPPAALFQPESGEAELRASLSHWRASHPATVSDHSENGAV